MDMLSFRNLADAGGPGFSEAQAEAVAAEYKIKDLDDKGEPIERAGRLADHFPAPFANELAAAAANGVAPPDMSMLAKARSYPARLPLVRVRLLHAVSGAGSGLHRGAPEGLRGPAARLQAAGGRSLQRIFPGPQHRDAAAAAGRAGDVRRRLAADHGAVLQGRRRLPDVGGRAAAGCSASASASR